jgi:transcriptional regulator with XRE-family HTH domain
MPQVKTVRPNGTRIRELRLELGLSPEELARRVGGKRHGQTIRRLERGAIEQASELLIHQIARELKVKAAELIAPADENGRAA